MRVLLGGLSASGEIAQVGTISANGDPKIGRMIAQAGQQWVSPGSEARLHVGVRQLMRKDK